MKKLTLFQKEFFTNLISSLRNKRSLNNAESIISKIVTEKSIQLWTISKDKKEYERFHNLINGKLIHVLDVTKNFCGYFAPY
jgi:hypothetical protein